MSTATSFKTRMEEPPQIPMKKWKDRHTSPDRNKVWSEPIKQLKSERKVPVVYYISRNGHLEHPHFMEVPLSSPQGLYLKDVINRLNQLRGKGMASLYSWSSKRNYKNGFLWHDLSENDFIYPAPGQEYILKGSEIVEPFAAPRASDTASSQPFRLPEGALKSGEGSDFPVVTRRRNQSWSSIDLHEYKVYKADYSGDSAAKVAADASTQTDDKRRRRKPIRVEIEEIEEKNCSGEIGQSQSTELSRAEISPPPSDSSPETLETLLKADGRPILKSNGGATDGDGSNRNNTSGRMRASSVLIQLLSCGSMSFKDYGLTSLKDQGLSLIGHYNSRLPRGGGNHVINEVGTSMEIPNFSGVRLEDKEYFSGSLIQTKVDVPSLKRSSSYNADRSSQLQLAEKVEGARSRCIPMKPKPQLPKKEDGICNIKGDGHQCAEESIRVEN